MARKTFSVEDFRNDINSYLARSADSEIERRKGMMNALESVLHSTGNYNGFCYLTIGEISGSVPGINEIDYYVWPEAKEDADLRYKMNFEGTDRTRVHYH